VPVQVLDHALDLGPSRARLLLFSRYECRAVAVGYSHKAQITFGPPDGFRQVWTSDHRLVAIIRE